MPRHTLGSFKTTANWVQFLGMDSSDPRWLLLLNESLERLMNMGLYCGTHQRYQFCACSACITWPRQFETIEVLSTCNRAFTIRNQWFEFLENGPGIARIKDCSTYNALDRGRGFVMFDDIREPSRLRLYTQFASDAGKVVNIRGYDGTGNWVLTGNGATVGENMTLTSTFVDSVTTWMPQVFREVIKPKTNGYVRAFSWKAGDPTPPASPGPTDTLLRPMAAWEPDETIPNYRRTFIPFLSPTTGRCGCQGDPQTNTFTPHHCNQSVTVQAKIAFFPLVADDEFIPLTCAPALKLAMLSVLRGERGDPAGAKAAMYGIFDEIRRQYVDGAVPLLENELATFQGSGSVVPLRIEPVGIGTGFVANFI